MKKLLCTLLALISIMSCSGCFKIHKDIDYVDDSLIEIVDYIYNECHYDIKVNAFDNRDKDYVNLRFDLIIRTEEIEEQFKIVNSVVHAVDDYLEIYDDIDGNTTAIRMDFRLPINKYSGAPGDEICTITNINSDGESENQMICIQPSMYGYFDGDDGGHYDFIVPDVQIYGIHILSRSDIHTEKLEEFLSKWSFIDTVIISTSNESMFGSAFEQAAELQSKYPDIEFIAR